MLKQETINSIAEILKVDAADFLAKLTSDTEEEVTLPKLNVFSDSELAARLKNEKATSYGEGKQAREEMLVKDAREKLDYPNDGSLKTFTDFMEYHNNQMKTKYSKDSTARVAELESDIKKLNENHALSLSQETEKTAELNRLLGVQTTTNSLLSLMPEKTTIEPTDIITLFNAQHNIVDVDGKQVVQKGGLTLKNETTADPLALKDVFDAFVAEKKYIAGAAGRGGSTDYGKAGSGSKTIEQFNESWVADGKSTIGSAYDAAYAEFRKAQTEQVA